MGFEASRSDERLGPAGADRRGCDGPLGAWFRAMKKERARLVVLNRNHFRHQSSSVIGGAPGAHSSPMSEDPVTIDVTAKAKSHGTRFLAARKRSAASSAAVAPPTKTTSVTGRLDVPRASCEAAEGRGRGRGEERGGVRWPTSIRNGGDQRNVARLAGRQPTLLRTRDVAVRSNEPAFHNARARAMRPAPTFYPSSAPSVPSTSMGKPSSSVVCCSSNAGPGSEDCPPGAADQLPVTASSTRRTESGA